MFKKYIIALATVALLWSGAVIAADETLFTMNSGGKDITVSMDGDTVTMSVKGVGSDVAPGAEPMVVEDVVEVIEPIVVEKIVPEPVVIVEPVVVPEPVLVEPVTKEIAIAETGKSSVTGANMGMLFFVFILAIFLGIELISKVPSQLHTPLMSGSNAISGITVVGALLAVRSNVANGNERMAVILGVLAVAFAMINVVGGYLVTDRMLGMFKHKD